MHTPACSAAASIPTWCALISWFAISLFYAFKSFCKRKVEWLIFVSYYKCSLLCYAFVSNMQCSVVILYYVVLLRYFGLCSFYILSCATQYFLLRKWPNNVLFLVKASYSFYYFYKKYTRRFNLRLTNKGGEFISWF